MEGSYVTTNSSKQGAKGGGYSVSSNRICGGLGSKEGVLGHPQKLAAPLMQFSMPGATEKQPTAH